MAAIRMAQIKHLHQVKAARERRQPPGVCLYVDNSNIFHEGQRFAENNRNEDRCAVRLRFENFVKPVRGAIRACDQVP